MKLKFVKFIFVIEDISVIKCRILYKNFAADLFRQNLDLSKRLEEEVRVISKICKWRLYCYFFFVILLSFL